MILTLFSLSFWRDKLDTLVSFPLRWVFVFLGLLLSYPDIHEFISCNNVTMVTVGNAGPISLPLQYLLISEDSC